MSARSLPRSSGGRIRRGVMAADQYTQIRNALFRDKRISFKAKGVFGLISTHRDGFGVTPQSIAACSTDGVSAVRSALQELERYGYLYREQERRPDGTMGPVEYFITDMPDREDDPEWPSELSDDPEPQNRRSRPVAENPHAADPHAGDHPHKKTSTKKTNSKNNTVRPSVPLPASEIRNDETDGGTDATPRSTTAQPHAAPSAGATLLLQIGHAHPELAVTGSALRDQGARLDALLAAGWTPDALTTALVASPKNEPVRNAGNVLSWRITHIPAAPLLLPAQAAGLERADPNSSTAADRTVAESVSRRVTHECNGRQGLCGRPVPTAGARCTYCTD